jgi:hypothetical protein
MEMMKGQDDLTAKIFRPKQFGILTDQPVLLDKEARFLGDSGLVIADTGKGRRGLQKISVE